MFSRASGVVIDGGTFTTNATIIQTNRTSRGIDLLMEWVATSAFYNSRELYDAPKCHPHTREAVLNDIMDWVCESEPARDDFMMWLFGPAGAGKSAIAKRIAEIADKKGLLIGTFFFSRTSPTRSTEDRVVASLAYQLALSIPETRAHIEDAIEQDPAIFQKNIQTQIDVLLVKPLRHVPIVPSQKLIIIDGLDECADSQGQVAVLDAIAYSFHNQNLPIIFLVVSRPELDLVTAFNSHEPLKYIHRRLALDDTYGPDNDIHLFFSDKFEHIRLTHPLKSTIPMTWPSQGSLYMLVQKSSGQFIYAATVIRFVESKRHRPTVRLNIILGIAPLGTVNPFAELDTFYKHILSSVEDIEFTLRVLRLYVVTPHLAYTLHNSMSVEHFLSLDDGDVYLALIDLSSIVSYDESSGDINILHASLVDFLSDKRRSTIYYIDMASTCTNFTRRIFQCIRGPDGMLAGHYRLFAEIDSLKDHIPKGQLRSEILGFDLDAFIKAVISRYYLEPSKSLDDADGKEALVWCNETLDLRVQAYQSDWRLQLLFTFAAAGVMKKPYTKEERYPLPAVPYCWIQSCRLADILLEMEDHDLHLLDQAALNLRHGYYRYIFTPELIDMMCRNQDDDKHAFAVLHCMRFLSNPPKFSKSNDSPLIYLEWKGACEMTLDILFNLLQQANTSPELVQFMSGHDIHPSVRKDFPNFVWQLDMLILMFLSRANVCVNWRIISIIRLATNDELPTQSREDDVKDEEVNFEMARYLRRLRLDQCCWKAHYHYP